jgi:glycerol-3-phosphate cytidylyltransferase
MENKVLTIGTFDNLHLGHIDLFKFCKQIAGKKGKVIVAVNTDEFIERYKGKRPTFNLQDRVDMIRNIKYVDKVVVHINDEYCIPTMETTECNFLVVGSDWLKKDYLSQINVPAEYFEQYGITLIYFPRTRQVSSTLVKERIRND